MRKVLLSDVTIRQYSDTTGAELTFREKLEIARLLDRLHVSVIELPAIRAARADSLLIKTVAQTVENSVLAVDAAPDTESVKVVWEAVKEAKNPRLRIVAALSPSRMEYVYHKKAEAMKEAVKEAVACAKSLCADVEFEAEDATRADEDFLMEVLAEAVAAGASTITLADTAGTMLPEEFAAFIDRVYAAVPSVKDVNLGVSCSNEMDLAAACAAAAVAKGASEVKVSACPKNTASLTAVTKILNAKKEAFDIVTDVETTEIKRVVDSIEELCAQAGKSNSLLDNSVREYGDDMNYSASDSMEDILAGVQKLGYDLDETDKLRVWKAFRKIAERKDSIALRELDVIAASETMQVPETYVLENYMVTTGNAMDIVAHVKLKKGGEVLDGLSLGDGPIDAAFLSIEKITGRHYELDDFQIQSITEGREAMGQTIVKLRFDGKLFAGRGLSTDIIGSAIEAYVSALNKIVHEEENA